jgi:hypothetical protein
VVLGSTVTACSSSDAAPTVADVVSRQVAAGMRQSVAECLAGLGVRELATPLLMPEADRTADQQTIFDTLVDSCEQASAFVLDGETESDRLAFTDGPDTRGDDPALDALWDSCAAGVGTACDELWESAPIGSDYERFGVTCGDRDRILDCAIDLTPETVAEIDASLAEA